MHPRSLLLAVAAASLLLTGCEKLNSMNAGKTKAGAPPGAAFLTRDVGAREVFHAVASAPAKDREDVRKSLIGMWTDKGGWEGEVEAVADEKDGWSIRMHIADPKVAGGIWIIALVPGEDKPDVERRYVVEVSGRIADIQYQGPNFRVILDGVTVVSSRQGN